VRPKRAILEPHPDSSLGLPLADEYLTLADALRWSVERYWDRRALTFEGKSWTYAELSEEVQLYAGALVEAGVGKGSRVAIMMGTRPEFVFLLYATAMVGGVSVLISTFSTATEARWILHHSDASLLVAHTEIRGRPIREELLQEIPGAGAADGPLRHAALPYLRRVQWFPNSPEIGDDLLSRWNDFLSSSQNVSTELIESRLSAVVPDDDASLLYTSGSTGTPKAVLHMHRAPTIQGFRMADCMAIGPADVTWTSFPTFWTAGLVTALFGPFGVGARTVLQESYEPAEALRLIEQERVSSIRQTAHDELRLVNEHERLCTDLSSVEIGVISSALRDLTLIKDEVCETCGWGMTETFTQFTMVPFDANIDVRRETSGELQPGDRLRIADPETREQVGDGEVGEITIAGPTLFRGYYKQFPLLPLDEAGYFHTGDTGYIDAHGRLVFTGRLDRLIKSGGVNISPVEIEERLLGWGRTGPCTLVGIPHPTLGQAAVLGVVHREGENVSADEVMDFLRGDFSNYKLPRRVLFFSAEEMPMTTSSKVVIAQLRDKVIQRLLDEDIDVGWKELLSGA
jgi:fatty-acyl-CoA synthase